MKAATLESRFPLMAVEHGCIISKDADITVAYRVELPEVFTLTRAEYEALHSTWAKAVRVLPNYSIVHKQDIFIEESYRPDICRDDLSFLSRSFERHFNERPYLNHTCYLFLTKTTKEHSRTTSSFNALTRGFIIPKEMQDKDTVARFLECCGQFERIVNDSGLVRMVRLTDEEIIGTETSAGIIEKYFSLSQEDTTSLQDITLGAGEMKVGDNVLCLHTLSETEDLPSSVGTDSRYERLSTDRSDCRLAPIGILLTCNHIVNQYLFIDDSAENLRKFEQTARNMHSLSRYSRSNQINREWIEEYLNEAHSKGLTSIRAHCNVFAWSDDREKLKRIKNDVGSQIALMEAKPRHNTVDVPTLFWAAIPGNAGDFPSEESFYTFIEQALCLFIGETSYKDSLSPFGIRMVDRLTGKPVHLDISDLPMKNGTITNRNKFILGPSGSGKSFFTNHMVRQYYEQGAHVLLVDTGNSYQSSSDLRAAESHFSPTTWCASIMNRERMCCWWTREIPIRGCAALSMPARMARTASISPMRRAIRLPSILSTWKTVRLISKRRSPSRRLSLPCGNVMTSRRHVPRRWHSPTRSISFWRRYARTVPWFRPSTRGGGTLQRGQSLSGEDTHGQHRGSVLQHLL